MTGGAPNVLDAAAPAREGRGLPLAPPAGLRLLVFGIDGATWDVIDPLIAQGRLPNLARLRRAGSWGRTLAEYRASPSLWTSIFTGKRREQHGIVFFGKTARSVRAKRLWEILDEEGWTIGICGPLMSWPPRPVNGFIIPDLFAPGSETYPPQYEFLQRMLFREKIGKREGGLRRHLRAQIRDGLLLLRHGVRPVTALAILRALARRRGGRSMDKRWREILLYPRIFGDVFVRLCRRHRPNLAVFHFHAADTISHMYWKYLEPEKFANVSPEDAGRYGPIVHRAYEAADAVLGQALRLATPETTVLVLSDHGFMARPDAQFKFELRFEPFVTALGLKGKVIGARFGNAFSFDFRAGVDPDHVAGLLRAVTIERTGEALFDVRPDEENLSIYLDGTRDLQRERLRFPGGQIIPFADLFEDRGFVVSGQHHPEGMCILAGAGVKPGVDLGLVPLYDIAPTLLALAGRPVGADMDGSPRLDTLDPAFLVDHPVRTIPTYEDGAARRDQEPEEEDERIMDRLRSLGYL